ncbi:MAG: hypothetical protein H0V56_14470, partial [Chthoniobacterales bacterium]|nr:hypothetical protein [Chthoniobacterales bacterium]
MKWLAAGLTFVNFATMSALLLGVLANGLTRFLAGFAVVFALVVAVVAFRQTRPAPPGRPAADEANEANGEENVDTPPVAPAVCYSKHVGFWIIAGVFAFFAFRSFCWLIYIDGNQLKIQSPHNLGDLALHLTYINNFASGVPLWPENPIHAFSKLRYPAGTDLFNALLLLNGIEINRGLVWAGLLGSLASFYALYRWGGNFAVAAFLFNGGLAGFEILRRWQLLDYQADSGIAWKSLPLTMLVTQRGLLYALPAGLLLLYHWRAKYFPPRESNRDALAAVSLLPFWLELSLYASMPLFHVHTFLALSLVAAFLFVIGRPEMRRQLLTVVAAAFLPATLFMWTITDHFRASSVLAWKPGWVQNTGDFAAPFLQFWLLNFGIFIPLVLVLLGTLLYRAVRSPAGVDAAGGDDSRTPVSSLLEKFRSSPALAFLTPAAVLFLFACLVKTAPWEWDNIKLIIWAYLLVVPFLWSELLARWPVPVRVAVCVALFASGFISLFGGLIGKRDAFTIAERAELDAVGGAVRRLPPTARFAAFPTYNHPLLLQGRRVVLGYPGHLWTQGFDYNEMHQSLGRLMTGEPDWREQARALGVRYL